MRIKNLRIEDFRGIRRFEMKNLGRINLIVGENNSGKTTILEALNFLMADGDTMAIWSMLGQRGEAVGVERSVTNPGGRPIQLWRLFRGFDLEVGATFGITAHTDAGVSSATATIAEYDPADPQSSGGVQLPPADPSEEILSPLLIRINWSHSESGGIEVLIPIRGRESISTFAVRRGSIPAASRHGAGGFPLRLLTASSLTVEAIMSLLDDIVLTPEEDLVLDALRIVDPKIQRIASSGSERLQAGASISGRGGVLLRLDGIRNRVPIGSLGDGIWRMLGLALNLVHSRDGFLLVDDIDTGLHHTVMEDMWKFLYAAASKYHVQVFATSHSRDCYESLAVLSGPSDSEHSDVTIQRVERGREQAVAYSERAIVAAAKHAIEVR